MIFGLLNPEEIRRQ